MIAVLRSELYRTVTVRASWVSIAVFVGVGTLFGLLSPDTWALLVGFGTFGIAVMTTAQHHQHRTALLLYLGEPNRLNALAGQAFAAVLVTTAAAAISGIVALVTAGSGRYVSTLVAVPLMALFGVANATIVRPPTWLFMGYGAWFVFIEGLIGKLDLPLPFSAFLAACGGDTTMLLAFAAWTLAALGGAVAASRRDLPTD